MFFNDMPVEIYNFFVDVFELCEVRGKVGEDNGVVFYMSSNEGNHNIPHVHASCGEFDISIGIDDGQVLAGNLPRKNQKIAVSWVKQNKENLLSKWKDIKVSQNLPYRMSRL